MPAKQSKKEFITKAREVHGDKYSYKETDLSVVKVRIYCRACKAYFDQSKYNHLYGKGCRKCGSNAQKEKMTGTLQQFIKEARKVHGKRFDYSKSNYAGSAVKLTIICTKCSTEFQQTPNRHVSGKCGCLTCENASRTKSNKDFIAEAKAVHGKLYDYRDTVYTNKKTPITVRCKSCKGTFERQVFSHLMGAGCTNSKCKNFISHGYSRMAIRWLEYEAKKRGIAIQHAENGGEFRIPKSRFRVDGYHEESNTVFEFHGDRYHGNPKVFAPDTRPNPFSRRTAAQLHETTKAREKLLKSLGYKLVVMWERDWKRLSL